MLLHLLSGCVSLHPGEELLRGSWRILKWLRRQVWPVSPSSGLVKLLALSTSIALSTVLNALSVFISKPPWHQCSWRCHYSTLSARFSVCDPPRPRLWLVLFALLLNWFLYFADWRAPPATFVARKQRTAKKRESGGYDQLMASYPSASSQDSVFQTLNPCISVYTCIFLEASGNCYISKILSYLFLSCLDPWYNSSLWKRSLERGTHRHDRFSKPSIWMTKPRGKGKIRHPGGCDGMFHLFHQVLGWSSCLRSPTNRHAVSTPWPDCLTGLTLSFVVSTTFILSLRRLRWVTVLMHSPSVVSGNPHDTRATDGYGAINRLSAGSRSLIQLFRSHFGSSITTTFCFFRAVTWAGRCWPYPRKRFRLCIGQSLLTLPLQKDKRLPCWCWLSPL